MKKPVLPSNESPNMPENKSMGFMSRLTGKNKKLSAEETREILTPFAFTIDESLFGVAIARPWRRGVALIIDLMLIGLLSQAPGELLAMLVAVTLFRLGSKSYVDTTAKKRGLRHTFLKFFAALIVFVVLADTLPKLFSQVDDFNRNVERAEQSEQYSDKSLETITQKVKETPNIDEALINNGASDNFVSSFSDDKGDEVTSENASIYKGFAWLKGLIEDMGIGFGWAAFYFTMFTAMWFGQTPGKKLLGIRVLQLDGTPLSVQDSFGRYGGYGAGIATGLLGFAQIYWDPNRQAIHDKISATIVIFDKGNKQA